MKSVFILGFFLIVIASSFDLHSNNNKFGHDFKSKIEPTVTYNYDRIDEVRKECSSILPPDSQKPHSGYDLRKKLSFLNGDWWQDLDQAPLMPSYHKLTGSLNLISFRVTHVDLANGSKNSVSINGVLSLSITNKYSEGSDLSISLQGIVTDTNDNRESVICLLGNTLRYPGFINPWDWVKEPGYMNQPPISQDDRILLVVRYPKISTLTKRGIYGTLKSLNEKASANYFDQVHISASSAFAKYEFSSQKLVSKACSPYPYNDSRVNTELGMYKGNDICRILELFSRQGPINIVPNWRCNWTNEICSKLSPFETDDASIKATNGNFKGIRLSFQDVRCEETSLTGKDGGFTKVAMLIRAVSPSDDFFDPTQRTGLNNMTLSAEGMWESSTGQLCMVGHHGNGFDSRICLYIPLSFSIKQRNIFFGTISSIKEGDLSYFPLAFEKLGYPSDLYNRYADFHPYYNYSKIELARTVLRKNEPFSIGTVIKNSLLKFPKVEDAYSYLSGLSRLFEDLRLQHPAVSDSASSPVQSCTFVEMEILSLGPLFGSYRSNLVTEEDTPRYFKTMYTDRNLLLNVSGQLSLTETQYENLSNVFVEGLYHPVVGKMFLVGCRDVRSSSNVLLYGSMDLEDGLDCLIEVVVSYPSTTTTRWLVNPTVTISISSQRNELDPLFFKQIKLQTIPVMHQLQQRFYSKLGDITIPAIVILVAMAVYVRQKLRRRSGVNRDAATRKKEVPYFHIE